MQSGLNKYLIIFLGNQLSNCSSVIILTATVLELIH